MLIEYAYSNRGSRMVAPGRMLPDWTGHNIGPRMYVGIGLWLANDAFRVVPQPMPRVGDCGSIQGRDSWFSKQPLSPNPLSLARGKGAKRNRGSQGTPLNPGRGVLRHPLACWRRKRQAPIPCNPGRGVPRHPRIWALNRPWSPTNALARCPVFPYNCPVDPTHQICETRGMPHCPSRLQS